MISGNTWGTFVATEDEGSCIFVSNSPGAARGVIVIADSDVILGTRSPPSGLS